MARRSINKVAYGMGPSVINISNEPLVWQRNPLAKDNYEIGQVVINESNDTVWMQTSRNALGAPVWRQLSSSSSAGVFQNTTDATLGPILLTPNFAYTLTNVGDIQVTLPAVCTAGDMIWLITTNSSAAGAGISVRQPAGMTVLCNEQSTSAGAGVKFLALNAVPLVPPYLSIAILLRCAVTNTLWTTLSCNVAPNLI